MHILGWPFTAQCQAYTQETCFLQILMRLAHLWDFGPLNESLTSE